MIMPKINPISICISKLEELPTDILVQTPSKITTKSLAS